ncbi:MAG: PKD domain-containing protein [Dehalococcoidia bacterium]|nr:PKD domain-containing protein [Dehalococcoidia bacterium]
MHKEPSWRAKAMYIVFACALVFGLAGVVAIPQQPAKADATNFAITASPDKGASSLDVTFNATWTGGVGAFNILYVWGDGTTNGSYTGVSSGDTRPHTYASSGVFNCTATLTDTNDSTTDQATIEIGVDPKLIPYIEYPEPAALKDVKGTVQKLIVVNIPGGPSEQDIIDDIAACLATGGDQPKDRALCSEEALHSFQRIEDEVVEWNLIPGLTAGGADADVFDGGGPTYPTPGSDPQNWIEIHKHTVGEAIVCVWLDEDLQVNSDGLGDANDDKDIQICVEKKWGEIHHTLLDLDASTPAWNTVTETLISGGVDGDCDNPEQVDAGTPGTPLQEQVADWVWAQFLMEADPGTFVSRAAHAVVHWWLIEDNEFNQAYLRGIMADLGSYDDCSGCGGYADWVAEPEYLIDKLAFDNVTGSGGPQAASDTEWKNPVTGVADLAPGVWDPLAPVPTNESKITTTTQDSLPGETRGLALAWLHNTGEDKVIVVTLVEYPDEYAGENTVCVEIGKKHFGVPPPPEIVKTPQVRWAGEKIVLEQDWSNFMLSDTCYVAVYHHEQQSVGEISPAGDNTSHEASEGDIWVEVGGTNDDVSEVLLETEVQGEADVNVKLYKALDCSAGSATLSGQAVVNYGFLVYFLAFEDVVLAEDITPVSGLSVVSPLVDVPVAVQVRGWFVSAEQPGTNRPALDVDGDGVYEAPAGRYVFPDDWWAIVGHSFDVYPNMDLMDKAHHDTIYSLDPLGPFNTEVRTADPPNVAEYPSIGPFNTLQRWSLDLMWIAEAATVPTSLVGENWRNTVVPDGIATWYDCPMPQALVSFDITAYTVATRSISGLGKGNLEGYGYTGTTKLYHSPFYQVEIPSHTLIPSVDYDWKSWDSALWQPYPYWTDLLKKDMADSEAGFLNTIPANVNDQDVEVYCDNHGIAGVTADALGEPGTITIVATAQFPAGLKAGKYAPRSSGEIPVTWGAIELNPHFVADKIDVAVEEVVTFDNRTAGGTHPYTKAEWDFDADGHIDLTIVNPTSDMAGEAVVMADVTNAYSTAGVYTVRLWMTDSTPTTRYEERPTYITVAGGVASHTWTFTAAGFFARHLPDTYSGTVVLGDLVLADIPTEVQGVYYYDPAIPGYTFWVPGVGGTLTTLGGGHTYDYQVAVIGACSWVIPLP